MKKYTKYIALFIVLTVFVSIFSACIEEENLKISTDNLIVFEQHTQISSFATNIPENPLILRNSKEVQEYLYAYVLSQPQNLSKYGWIKTFLEGFDSEFFETKAFILLRDTWHSESYKDFFICGIYIENKTLVINLHYVYDGGELKQKMVSNSYIISVNKEDIKDINFTGIREINYFNSVS